MQILLANAKIMNSQSKATPVSTPAFQDVANRLAFDMSQLDIDELAEQLDCSRKIALENFKRYQEFGLATPMPAIMAYNGQAYKHLKAPSLSNDALAFGQKHLWITCFLYGLLRPMDAVVPYRMEHCVRLQTTDDVPLNQYWESLSLQGADRQTLTDVLIESVKADDGVLVHLSTEEYEHLFDWKRVKKEVKVVQPLFYVRKGDDLKIQAVWAKTCRGAMVRYILENQIEDVSDLSGFSYEGFAFDPKLGEEQFPHFVR